MKKNMLRKRSLFLFLFGFVLFPSLIKAAPPKQEYYQLKVYELAGKTQEDRVDNYLKNAFLPALHRLGIKMAGVFKPLGNDTASTKKIYVLIPFHSLDHFVSVYKALEKDDAYLTAGKDYLDAPYNDPAYNRIHSVLLYAFPDMPVMSKPVLGGTRANNIYELRSYQSASEKLHDNKVKMFNEGGEVPLFARLHFNAVFYARVISGDDMPNLMYMTSFTDQESHDQHWKAFGDDPEWKKLSADPQYQHNVSHIDIMLLHPADYSDL